MREHPEIAERIEKSLNHLHGKVNKMTASIQDVANELTTLKSEITSKAGDVTAALKSLTDQVTALRNSGTANAGELDGLLAQVKDVENAVATIPGASTATGTPAPDAAPAPVVPTPAPVEALVIQPPSALLTPEGDAAVVAPVTAVMQNIVDQAAPTAPTGA